MNSRKFFPPAPGGGSQPSPRTNLFYFSSVGACGRQVTSAVGVGDADDNERRAAAIVGQEIEDATDFIDMAVAIGQVQDGVAVLFALGSRRHSYQYGPVLI